MASLQTWRNSLNIGDICDVASTKYNGACKAKIVNTTTDYGKFNGDPKFEIHFPDWPKKHNQWISNESRRLSPPNTLVISFNKIQVDIWRSFFGPLGNCITICKSSPIRDPEHKIIDDNDFLKVVDLPVNVYPFKESVDGKVRFIDSSGLIQMKCSTQDNKDKINIIYGLDGFKCKFIFIVDNELHLLYPNNIFARSNMIKHVKYNTKAKQFVPMDDIMNIQKLKCEFKKRKFFYNTHQQRLYMITFGHKGDINISFIDDINGWKTKWKVSKKRKWSTIKRNINSLGIYVMVEPNKWHRVEKWNGLKFRMVIVYNTILLMLFEKFVLLIDLLDFQMHKSDKYLDKHLDLGGGTNWIIHFCGDESIYFPERGSKRYEFITARLKDIIPFKLLQKYKIRAYHLIVGFICGHHAETDAFPRDLVHLVFAFVCRM